MDHERILELCRKTVELFCGDGPTIPLVTGGTFLCKIWDGDKRKEFADYLMKHFETVRTVKPRASRDNSSELYLLAQKFR